MILQWQMIIRNISATKTMYANQLHLKIM